MLRDYQRHAIDKLQEWLSKNAGDPCLVMPTGSGKSWIVAELCRAQKDGVLVLSHSKEILSQDADKIFQHYPEADVCICSASLKKKEYGCAVTVAGVQTLFRNLPKIGHIDLCIIDEAHLVPCENPKKPTKKRGVYRSIIDHIRSINPNVRVVGLTATPWRLGFGEITGEGSIFTELLDVVSIEQLITQGRLAPLRSKGTSLKIDASAVKKIGGDYSEKDLQTLVDTDDYNSRAVDEIIARSHGRRSWLIFCTGVAHSLHIMNLLNERGIAAANVTGDTPMVERDRILSMFEDKQITALTNANVLTTGFDCPDVDLIAFLRPTKSVSLYVQMAGRGMRPKDSPATDCIVLDFVGLVMEHGPVTNPCIPGKPKSGDAPVRECPSCMELVSLSFRKCPACGFVFPIAKKPPKKVLVYDNDIMGRDNSIGMDVTRWEWDIRVSFRTRIPMLVCSFHGARSTITQFLCVAHTGYAKARAVHFLKSVPSYHHKLDTSDFLDNLSSVADDLNNISPPESIIYKQNGKYFDVLKWEWSLMNEDIKFEGNENVVPEMVHACKTCCQFKGKFCYRYNAIVPDDFQDKEDACPKWDGVPF